MAGKNKFTSLQTIRGWTCDDVQRALTKHDLKDCCGAIEKRNIDGEALLNLTEGKLALWKQDLKKAEIERLSTFVVNINFYPEKYSDSAEVRGLSGAKAPSRAWNQPTPTSTPSPGRPAPPPGNKPTPPGKPGFRSAGSSNGFNTSATQQAHNKFSKTNVASNVNKPNPPSNFNKPNPPSNFNKPNPPSNFNKPNPPSNFNKPNPPSNFNKPNPPSNFNKPAPSNAFNKPSPPSNAARPIPNASRLFSGGGGRPTPPQTLQTSQAAPNEYLPMGRKSPLPSASPVLTPTTAFTKKPLPAPPQNSFYPPPEPEYPVSEEEDDDQPEYLNVDAPAAYPPPDDGHHSDASWGTDFDDTEQDDLDLPPEVPAANKSSLFGGNGTPSLPQRPANREPALPARPAFQPPSAFGYPQPPAAIDNHMLNGLIGQDAPEYADDEEYSLIDEFEQPLPPPPALAPREYLNKPRQEPMPVPEAMAPSVPHREPVVILPRSPGQFGGATPKLPPREPYLNRFPRFPAPPAWEESYPAQEAEDDSEYEVIEHREGDDDYLAPTGMNHAVSSESVASSTSGMLAEKLRDTLIARKISLSQPRPETPPPPLDHRDKTPTIESKPLPKGPAFDRQFSSNQPQRPLPPPPEPTRRPSGGATGGGGGGGQGSLKTKQWYHDVDRRRGEDMLRNGEDGSFLLRPSARTENPLTLTLWYENRIYNIGVRLRKDQRYALGTEKAMERSFGSVDELVAFYQRDLLMLYSGGEKTGSTYLTETPGRRYMSH